MNEIKDNETTDPIDNVDGNSININETDTDKSDVNGNIEVVNENNIICVIKDREAPKYIRTHNRRIKLPASDEQKSGFYHKDAKIIINTFPEFYKDFVKKGESN